MTKGNNEAVFVTGLRRGYICVANRKEGEYIALPESLKGLRGNLRKALEKFAKQGCTHYTIQDLQLAHNSQYCYTVYRGYKED